MGATSHVTAGLPSGMRLEPSGVSRIALAVLAFWAAAGWGALPALNSDYRAPHVLYLDFDGHYQPISQYQCSNRALGGWTVDFSVTDISTDIDPDVVRAIWEAVAEDYAPFRVNVSTDPRYAPDATAPNAVRVAVGIVSLDLESLGAAPANCESDSLANPIYLNGQVDNVAVVKLDPSGLFSPLQVAKRISHEAGHVYGLAHHTAKRGLLDDWIMAAQRSASRYIWRSGLNESGRFQHDIDHLGALLGLRADESQPSPLESTGYSLDPSKSALYAHGTLTSATDLDDFEFSPVREGTLEFRLSPGIWTGPLSPTAGAESNASYGFRIMNQSGTETVACPGGTVLTMAVVSAFTLGVDCLDHPPALRVGETYRIRVFAAGPAPSPGHVGRYTIAVRDVTPKPTTSQPIVRYP